MGWRTHVCHPPPPHLLTAASNGLFASLRARLVRLAFGNHRNGIGTLAAARVRICCGTGDGNGGGSCSCGIQLSQQRAEHGVGQVRFQG